MDTESGVEVVPPDKLSDVAKRWLDHLSREEDDEPMNGCRILVWRFHDAPEWMRELSPHGGDEDWLAYVPVKEAGGYVDWMQSDFGHCDVSRQRLPDGSEIRIGAHA